MNEDTLSPIIEENNISVNERFDLTQIIRRQDNSYVVNGGTYHVPDTDEWSELWSEINTYAQEHPDCVADEPPYEPLPEEIAAVKMAKAKAIIDAHVRRSTAQTATFSVSEFATLAAAHLFDTWHADTSYSAGQRIEYNGVAYEVVQAVTA